LADARRKAEEARVNVARDLDPSDKRKATKADQRQTIENESRIDAGLPILNSFADLAGQWLKSVEHLTKPTTQYKKSSRLERLAFPTLGDMDNFS
jgi:hypothetical protein